MLLHTPGRWLHHRPKLGRRLLTFLSSIVFPSSPLVCPRRLWQSGPFCPWILLSHAPLGAPLPCKRTNGTGYYGCCKRGDTTRKGQSALRSGASSLAFFNLKPSFHGRDDVLSLSMTWNVHILYIYILPRFFCIRCMRLFMLLPDPSWSFMDAI